MVSPHTDYLQPKMSSQQPGIISSLHSAQGNSQPFPLFACLPGEIRLEIWRCSMQRERIIHVELTSIREKVLERYANINHLQRPTIEEAKYKLLVNGWQVLSKFLRVNSESRQEALSFYRIHIPCWFRGKGEEERRQILHINPEYDFILPVPRTLTSGILTDFLYDLKAYDPNGIGLVNLAINRLSPLDRSFGEFWTDVTEVSDEPARTAMKDTLSQIKEIFFVTMSSCVRMGACLNVDEVPTYINTSYPTAARTATFDRVGLDPRPVIQDLSYKFIVDKLPTFSRGWWDLMLHKWGVQHAQPVEFRVLLAIHPNKVANPCHTNDGVFVYEYETVDIKGRLSNSIEDLARDRPMDSTEGPGVMDRARGFWLFPIEILRRGTEVDLAGLRPELALQA